MDKTIAAKCLLNVNGMEVRVIIDSGAATNIITNTLRKKLGVQIMKGSNTMFTMANGKKTPSLGKTIVTIVIVGRRIPVEVQVIESTSEELLLGNELFRELKAIIDYENKKIIINYQQEKFELPIYFTKKDE